MNETTNNSAFQITARPQSVFRALFWLVVVLVIVGVLANLVIYHVAPSPEHRLARLMHRFDLGYEPSIPNWYSSVALLFSAMLLLLIAKTKQRATAPYSRHWFLLAVIFLGLALDEAVLIHEMVDTVLHEILGTEGIFYFAWVIPGMLFALLLAGVYARFILDLDARTRYFFLGAGAIYLSGAIGMEMVAGVIVQNAGNYDSGIGSWAHTLSQGMEEFLEMLGIVVFIYGLLDYISRHIGTIKVLVIREKSG